MRKNLCRLAAILACTGASMAQVNAPFHPGCPLPFEEIKVKRKIDKICGAEGSAADRAGKLQNRMKNNFCVKTTPVELNLAAFRKLQNAADKRGIWRHPKGIPSPQWRAKLKNIHNGLGEGDAVSFIGFIDAAYDAVTEKGESVSCDLDGPSHNDIHLELAERIGPAPCERVITEISPHFRPKKWTSQRLQQVRHAKLPIRVTGHLFWDASHSPCGQGEPEQWRATTWEIHPVYWVEVCKKPSVKECRNSGPADWVPLHEWEPGAWVWDNTNEAPVQPD